MKIGIDSLFSVIYGSKSPNGLNAMKQLLERIIQADEVDLALMASVNTIRKNFWIPILRLSFLQLLHRQKIRLTRHLPY